MPTLRLPRSRLDWFMLAAGGAVLAACLNSIWWGYASMHWPRLDAVVIESKAHHVAKGSYLEIRHEFECGARRCVGDRWRYRTFSDSPDTIYVRNRSGIVDAAVASYPKGQRVKVAVKPGDPEDSVLEPGVSSDDVFFAVFGLLFVLAAFVSARREGEAAMPPPARPAAAKPRWGAARVLAWLGAVLMAIGLYVVYRGAASAFWPETQGAVLYRSFGSVGTQGIDYRAAVRYEYFVDGNRYLGDASAVGSGAHVKEWIAPLQKGATVKVHYNPLDAGDSLIDAGVGWRDFVLPVLASILLGIAWLLQKAKESLAMRMNTRDHSAAELGSRGTIVEDR